MYWPALHGSGAVEPVGAHSPLTTLTHCTSAFSPVLSDQVPPGQGVGALLPSLPQYEPTGQTLQLLVPTSSWYSPGEHGVQLLRPVSGCALPGLQSFGSTAPVLHAEPAGQAAHCSLLPSPTVLLCVPATHGKAAEAPSSQYEPAGHSTHAVCPLPAWKRPAAQGAQSVARAYLDSFWNLPGEHVTHAEEAPSRRR